MENRGNDQKNIPVILIVDDNPQNLQVLGKQLQDKKYEIEFAINGQAALEWINTKKFDLILLDINMPGMSGFEVCTKIRSTPELNNIPIIFLSADTDRESILKGFELGAQDYITKPFDSRELVVRVKTHLSLKDSLEKLENMNKILEEKVLERTIQLRETNNRLEETNLKLIDLDKAKSEFLRLISHEIRTPLNGILGPLELLKGPVYANEIGDLIEILDMSVRRLEKFSLDALLITRLKTKQKDLEIEKVSLSKLFTEVFNENIENIELKKLKLDRSFDKMIDIIEGEKGLIKKAIANIFENSVYFSPMEGSINVKTYSGDEYNVFEIRDHGYGFVPGAFDHLSELFTNADNERDTSMGIGLPIVKLIMESHHGDFFIHNHPEGGAVVELCFPKNN
jgi:two-component system, sensor histidine kinase and response regulator